MYSPNYNHGPSQYPSQIEICLRKYVTFSGRARRLEYWSFAVFVTLVSFVLDILPDGVVTDFLFLVFNLATFLPWLAVTVRRLHDIDFRGWWALLGLLPEIGWIPLLVMLCWRGSRGDNRFGPAVL